MVADENAAARVFEVYGPNHRRLAALFATYGPEEIAVLSDWFTRAADIMRTSLDEVRQDGSAT
ncbi:hypothetical protein [Streptomyces sp. NPDC096153]|uniref:hypothetical protein n=1 Tax=Streptomyces sp. NPDC096153 TaxID=3155548 RepID=UPI00331EB9D0